MSMSATLVTFGTIVGIYALLALGLNIKFGYAGLLDFGHVAFFLVGAYVTALLVLPPPETQALSTYVLGWEWPWVAAIAAGTVVAGVFGLLIALPAIRLREDYLAIALLGISVIVKRTVQTETWIANGPDNLRGYDLPLRGEFPIPDQTLLGALLLGVIVLVFWSVAVHLLSRTDIVARRDGRRRQVVHALLAATTLGIGYLGARYARTGASNGRFRYSLAVGAVVGAVATALSVIGLGPLAVLLFVGTISLFTWVFAGVLLAEHYTGVTRKELLVALGLAVAFALVFAPVGLFGTASNELLRTVAIGATVPLLAAFLYGVYYARENWSRFDVESEFVRVVGIAALWLFVFRYFGATIGGNVVAGNVGSAIVGTIENLLWLVEFGRQIGFDYSRFLFTVVLATVGLSYLLMEITVHSPFGRVLKAIREDEDVAMALGKNPFSYKVQSMVLGSALAGLAGGYAAIYYQTLSFRLFDPEITFFIFLIVIIGGTANNRGVILGAVLYWAFIRGTNDIAAQFPTGQQASIQALRLAGIGALLILILYYRPEGVWGEERTVAEVTRE